MSDRAAAPRDAHAGRTVAGTYRMEEVIGRGAMGVVYRAHSRVLDRPCAVKVVRDDLAGDPHVRARLLREAETLMRLAHRHIVPLRHVGEEDGVLFLVMDLCEGETLDVVLAREGPLPEARARAIALQILAALGEAHAQGIVHRDLKPANVMVERRTGGDGRTADHVRVLDFGLGRLLEPEGQPPPGTLLTSDGDIVGTVAYMSPEQLRASSEVDGLSW